MDGDFLFVNVVGEREALRNLDLMPDTVRAILVEKLHSLTEKLAEQVEDNIYSRLSKTPEKEGRDHPRLRDSVLWEVIDAGSGPVEGKVYIDETVPYARIQEQGGSISPHMIFPRDGKILAFRAATGDKVFATHVFHPGGVIPPTYYMKDAYRKIAPEISRQIKNSIVQGIRQKMRQGNG